ncbi:MAG: sugar phosphate nucleotidyltransferase [bacterium]|nr:sugar phosphate nucleotidyltransferase [bacterium]
MKGIILAGGTGTRLLPLTAVTSKQLLPVYDRPMIFYPLNTLIKAEIKDILIIVAPDHSGHFLNLLGSMFEKFGVHISFMVQKQPRGLAEAFILGEDFIDGESTTLVLGDNIFEDDFTEAIETFEKGGRIFAKAVADPERSGVVEFNDKNEVISIEEKPEKPKSRFAIPGIYIFDRDVVEIAKSLTPSARGELEIVDVHKSYLAKELLDVRVVQGAWFDTGTHESLFEASQFVREHEFAKYFHPMVNDAISEFNNEYKKIISLNK